MTYLLNIATFLPRAVRRQAVAESLLSASGADKKEVEKTLSRLGIEPSEMGHTLSKVLETYFHKHHDCCRKLFNDKDDSIHKPVVFEDIVSLVPDTVAYTPNFLFRRDLKTTCNAINAA